jgi:hypothetical protein
VRTLLVFARSIKPDKDVLAVESQGNSAGRQRYRAKYRLAATVKSFPHQRLQQAQSPSLTFKTLNETLLL